MTALGTPFGGKYVLDATKQPPRITMFTSQWKSGEKIPQPISVSPIGIYKIDGDRLTIAYRKNGPAPDKFESTPGSDVTLLELKRRR